MLPLSTAGCPENVLHVVNSTIAIFLNSTSTPDDLLNTSTLVEDLHLNATLHDGSSDG